MRKMSFAGFLYLGARWVCVSLFGIGAAMAVAQVSGPSDAATPAMPKDGKELMLLAAKSNGLTAPGLQPWHLKASFQLLDEKGAVADEGTIEEWWAGHHKIRLTYQGRKFSQTTYWTDTGILQSGSAELPSYLIPELRAAVVEPLPPAEFLDTQSFEVKERDLGSVKLICVEAKMDPLPKTDSFLRSGGPTYCMSTARPILRINIQGQGLRQALGNQIAIFQGRYIPQTLRIVQQDKTVATLRVDSLETIKTPDDSVFAPSADTMILPTPIAVLSGVANGLLVTKALPHYPIVAKQSHIQGTIILAALIGKDGKISDLQVISGPTPLREAALDAVKQWVYWPYFVDGEAVEIATKINVVFSIGG